MKGGRGVNLKRKTTLKKATYIRVKELAKEVLINSFWIQNESIKTKELSESQPVSVTDFLY